MKPKALGYLGVNAKSLADWADYATRLAGMQIVEKAGGGMALRMDDRKQRLVIEENGGDGVAYFGWEMEDAEALGAFCATLDAAGVRVEPGTRALADQRRVKDLVVVTVEYRVGALGKKHPIHSPEFTFKKRRRIFALFSVKFPKSTPWLGRL